MSISGGKPESSPFLHPDKLREHNTRRAISNTGLASGLVENMFLTASAPFVPG